MTDQNQTTPLIERCPHCKRELVWHEGAFSGWVHSNNLSKNHELNNLCMQERRQ